MPTARSAFGCILHGDNIHCIGAYLGASQALAVHEVYDIVTNTWNTRASMPTARGYFSCVLAGDSIHCIGGYTTANTAVHEVYKIISITLGYAKKGDIIYSSSIIRVGDVAIPASIETEITQVGLIVPVTNSITKFRFIRKNSSGVILYNITSIDIGAIIAFLRPGDRVFTTSDMSVDGVLLDKYKEVVITQDSVLKSEVTTIQLLWIN